MSPSARRSRISLRAAPALAAGEDGDADAGGVRQRRDGFEMLARQDLGRRHEGGLPAGLDHRGGGDQRHHRLAGADIALQQAQHALRAREVGDDVVDGILLRMGERIRQRLHDARAQAAFAGASRCRTAGAYARAPAPARVGRRAVRHRRAASRLDSRAARHAAHAAGANGATRRRIGGKRSRETQASILPFRQRGQPGKRAVDRAAHIAERESLGERIDRLDQRQRRRSLFHPPRGRDAPSAACRRRTRRCRRHSGSRRPAGAFPGNRAAR